MKHRLGLSCLALTLLVGLGLAASIWGHLRSDQLQAEVLRLRGQVEAAHRLMGQVSEGDRQFRGLLLYGQPAYAEGLFRSIALVEAPASLALAEAVDSRVPGESTLALSLRLHAWAAQRRAGHLALQQGQRETLLAAGQAGRGNTLTDDIRTRLDEFLHVQAEDLHGLKAAMERASALATALVAAAAMLCGLGLVLGYALLHRQRQADAMQHARLARSNAETAALLRLTDMLHACHSHADVEAVVRHAAPGLLPGHGGTLFLPAAEGGEALRPAASWGAAPAAHPIGPGGCFSLRRGRVQSCGTDTPCAARCATGGGLCLPLSARGEAHGMLRVAGLAADAPESALAHALADNISLAVANIALRERLQGEALRDPLTGLHNRRFLDEVGAKLAAQAERSGRPLAVVVLDLDHFKALNDRHGHAAGDAALRRVGTLLREGLRGGDVACRHGGEEFALLLPDCTAEAAAQRAEALRQAIERSGGGPGLSASLGVAALPARGGTLAAAMEAADAALYRAKAGGRNRVVLAAEPAAALAAE
ncbi:diguanylate cyclase [Roseococcus sp. DSY-14]|uniref:GGDEF domain-containing protein n=1 Tax=Roseococcus sp. DSY-14 TaxID=3369650 RepID=UPI00387B24A1